MKNTMDCVSSTCCTSATCEDIQSASRNSARHSVTLDLPGNVEEFNGARISPAFLDFSDVYECDIAEKKFTIMNISNEKLLIKISEPTSLAFKLDSTTRGDGITLAPGLTITKIVKFSNIYSSIEKSWIPITIKNSEFQYYLYVRKMLSMLKTDPAELDFGFVNIASSVVSRELVLENLGDHVCSFETDVDIDDIEISIIPYKGTIRPKKRISLKVELSCFYEGDFVREFWIKCNEIYPLRVSVIAKVIVPHLKITHHPGLIGNFITVSFEPTFFGTQRYSSIRFLNVNAYDSMFTFLVQNDSTSSSAGAKDCNAFIIEPNEGSIASFEERNINIFFRPTRTSEMDKGWKHLRDETEETEYLEFGAVFYIEGRKITDNGIQCRRSNSTVMKETHKEMKRNRNGVNLETKSRSPIQVCLYGIAVKAVLKIYPSAIDFNIVQIYEEKSILANVRNPSKLPIYCKYLKTVNIDVIPSQYCVKPREEIELVVKLKPTKFGRVKSVIKFEMLSQKCSTGNEMDLVVLGCIYLDIKYTVPAKTPYVEDVSGISLNVKHAANGDQETINGIISQNDMTIRKLPTYNEMVHNMVQRLIKKGELEDRSTWLGIKDKVYSDTELKSTCIDIKSYLNDFYDNNNDEPKRTVYRCKKMSSFRKNLLLDVPVADDTRYNWTIQERQTKDLHDLKYLEYIRNVAKSNKMQLTKVRKLPDYKLQCRTSCSLLNTKRSSMLSDQSYKKMLGTSISEKSPSVTTALSPHQLYKIDIYPRTTLFGQVTNYSKSRHILTVINRNEFAVEISVKPATSDIKVLKSNTEKIPPLSESEMELEYTARDTGVYSGFINYIINGHHVFEIPVSVEVVTKSLLMDTKEIVFGTGSGDKAFPKYFQSVEVANPTCSTTNFTWKILNDSSFSIYPVTGEILPNRSFTCTLYYKPEVCKLLTSDILLEPEEGPFQSFTCNALLHKARLYFLESKIFLDEIPLNNTTKFTAMLFNTSYEDVLYTVSNSNPIPGCSIFPSSGVIKARIVQQKTEVKLEISGSVGIPKVVIKPNRLQLKRISADSFDSVPFTAENVGSVTAYLEFKTEDMPEFRISLDPSIHNSNLGSEVFSLKPKEKKQFYLHFKPTEVTTYEFLLPVVLNEILGPPSLYNEESQMSGFYLDPLKEKYFGIVGIKNNSVTERLPCVKVESTVTCHVLSFSQLNFKFFHVPGYESLEKKLKNLTVKNIYHQPVSFCIRTDIFNSKESPFKLQCHDYEKVEEQQNSLTISFDPEQCVAFTITFEPTSPGLYEYDVPVFVRGQDSVFNYIHLKGLYPKPSLKSDVAEIIIPPIPLGIELETKTYLTAWFYPRRSKVSFRINKLHSSTDSDPSDKINLIFPAGNDIMVSDKGCFIPMSVKFFSNERVSFKAEICFTDDEFGGKCSFLITAVAENCALTTHAFLYNKFGQYHIKYVTSGKELEKNCCEDQVETSFHHNSSVRLEDLKYSQQLTFSRGVPFLIRTECSPETFGEVRFNNVSKTTRNSEESETEDLIQLLLLNSDQKEYHLARRVHEMSMATRESDLSYSEHMSRTLKAAETWLFEQGFRCTYAAALPEGMSNILGGLFSRPRKQMDELRSPCKLLTVVDLLKNLVGSQALNYFSQKSKPEVPVDRVLYVHTMYMNMIKFLNAQGACLDHILSKYLLNYGDYLLYKINKTQHGKVAYKKNTMKIVEEIKLMKNNSKHRSTMSLLSEDEFKIISTQSWLDLILQIYKTLILSRITYGTFFDTNRWPNNSPTVYLNGITSLSVINEIQKKEQQKKSNKCNVQRSNVYSDSECILLAWLQEHYRIQIKLFKTEHSSLLEREITNFDSDLQDGLILVTVTTAYCPYLKDIYFQNLYWEPCNREQLHHNAARLVDAWTAVDIGFTTAPDDITSPNVVQMIMLVTHLYENLPSLYPRSVICFEATLNEEGVRKIKLHNPSVESVTFNVRILGDSLELFKTEYQKKLLRIPRSEDVLITLRYCAKKIGRTTATLILIGTSVAPNFCKNLAFSLEGEATHLKVTSSFKLHAPLYIPTKMTIRIKPPFSNPALYDINIATKEPKRLKNYEALSWNELKKRFPHPLFLLQSQLSGESGDVNMIVTCLTLADITCWLIFTNRTIGDFVVKVSFCPNNSSIYTPLTALLPVNISGLKCKCSEEKKTCPLLIKLRIPCINFELTRAIREMFDLMYGSDVRKHCNKEIDVHVMLSLMKWVLENTQDDKNLQELQHVFNKSVIYNVRCSSEEFITAPCKLKIEDVQLPSFVPYNIHVNCNIPERFEFFITFTSEDGKETRNYEVKLLKSDHVDHSISSEQY